MKEETRDERRDERRIAQQPRGGDDDEYDDEDEIVEDAEGDGDVDEGIAGEIDTIAEALLVAIQANAVANPAKRLISSRFRGNDPLSYAHRVDAW